MADLNAMRAAAMKAAKDSSKWAYRNNYFTGEQTISAREPTAHTRHLTTIRSPDYAKARGCSLAVARRELSKLVEWEQITEDGGPRGFGMRTWRLHDCDADRIGREHIAALRAEGLPFDDEWRATRKNEADDDGH